MDEILFSLPSSIPQTMDVSVAGAVCNKMTFTSTSSVYNPKIITTLMLVIW